MDTPDTTVSPPTLRLLRASVRARWFLVLVPLAAVVACVGYEQLRMTYVAQATVRPQGGAQGSNRLGSLAAQFGVMLPNQPIGDPLRFQAQLFETREVLRPVVMAQYAVATSRGALDSTHASLLDLFNVKHVASEERQLRGIDELKKRMVVQTDPVTGLITVRVTTRWPEVSLAVVQRLLDALQTANTAHQQAAAEAEARFSAARLASERAGLDSAEAVLETFLLRNRQYQSSPELVLEYGRLQRRIDLAQAVVTSLAQAYEQARMDAARDTPVMSIIDRPEGSVRHARRPVRDGVIWALMALAAVLLVLLSLDAWQQFRVRHPEETEAYLQEIRRGLTRRSRS
jgi:uncharacterized protein involved in exopolysaccharide biosynthesis